MNDNVIPFPKMPVRDPLSVNNPDEYNPVFIDHHTQNKAAKLASEIVYAVNNMIMDNDIDIDSQDPNLGAYNVIMGNVVLAYIYDLLEMEHPFQDFIQRLTFRIQSHTVEDDEISMVLKEPEKMKQFMAELAKRQISEKVEEGTPDDDGPSYA